MVTTHGGLETVQNVQITGLSPLFPPWSQPFRNFVEPPEKPHPFLTFRIPCIFPFPGRVAPRRKLGPHGLPQLPKVFLQRHPLAHQAGGRQLRRQTVLRPPRPISAVDVAGAPPLLGLAPNHQRQLFVPLKNHCVLDPFKPLLNPPYSQHSGGGLCHALKILATKVDDVESERNILDGCDFWMVENRKHQIVPPQQDDLTDYVHEKPKTTLKTNALFSFSCSPLQIPAWMIPNSISRNSSHPVFPNLVGTPNSVHVCNPPAPKLPPTTSAQT